MTRSLSDSVVLLAVDEMNVALHLETVERVLRAVEIAPLPDAPRGVLGVINLHGKIVPVFDLRVRFGLPARDVRAGDYLVIARMRARLVALLADAVLGVVPAEHVQIIQSSEILPEMECISGVMKFESGLVFLHDLEKFFSLADYEALQVALSR